MLEGIYWARHKQDVGLDWEVAQVRFSDELGAVLWFFREEYPTAPQLYDLVAISLLDPDGRPYPYKETST